MQLELGNTLSLFAIFVAIIGLWIAYIAARYQLKLFVLNVLSIKAKEANDYMGEAETDNKLNEEFLHCISSIIQGWQMAKDLMDRHKFFLIKPPIEEFENFLYLHLKTTIKDYIFLYQSKIRIWLVAKIAEAMNTEIDEIKITKRQLNCILIRLEKSHIKFDPDHPPQPLFEI